MIEGVYELILATCGTSFTGRKLNEMFAEAADHSCAAIRRYFGLFLYTNLFQFVYNFRMSCLNGLLQITPLCVNVIEERTLTWLFWNIDSKLKNFLCLCHSGVYYYSSVSDVAWRLLLLYIKDCSLTFVLYCDLYYRSQCSPGWGWGWGCGDLIQLSKLVENNKSIDFLFCISFVVTWILFFKCRLTDILQP